MSASNVVEFVKEKTRIKEKAKPETPPGDTTYDPAENPPLFSGKTRRMILKIADISAHFTVAYLLGICELPFSVYPLGTAMMLCVRRYRAVCFAGAVTASFGYGNSAISGICLNFLAFFLRYLFQEQKDAEKSSRTDFLPHFIFAVAVGMAFCWAGNFTPQSVMKGSFYAICFITAAVCFSIISEKRARKRGRICFDGVFFGAVALFSHCLSGAFIGVLSPQLLFAFMCIVFAAHKGGAICGLCAGAVSGIVCAVDFPAIAIPLAAAGYVSGVFSERFRKTYASPLAFLAVLCAVFLCFSNNITQVFTTAVISVILYLPLTELMPKRSAIPFVRTSGSTFFKKSTCRDIRLSEALSSVSQITYNISDKLKYPSEQEVREEVNSILSSFCEGCPGSAECGKNRLCDSETAVDTICTRLMSGGFLKTDLPENEGAKCTRLDEMTRELCDSYSKLIYDRFRDNKTEILASEYSSMARLIKHTSHKTISDTVPDEDLKKSACAALCAVGIRFSQVEAFGEREKTVLVHGTSAAGFPCTAAELSAYMSKKCGMLFDEPEFLGVSEGCVMRLKRKPCLRVEYARGARAKGGGKLNGDTAGFFETDENYFYALISDGMGSGRSAALTSRLTSVFIEKLLTTGSHKNVTLELLNNLLLSKSDESFATVDLLEIDLYTGQACFVKAGAAPAYVLRSSKLYKIASCTPPAGIVRYFNAENTKFVLEKGDMVVMLSDGIVQSSDDVPWLCEMLGADNEETPAQIAEKIIEKAKKMNLRDDDMTCVAVKVM